MKTKLHPRIWWVLLLPLLIYGITAAGIVLDGLTDNLGNADIAVVLGTKVNPDGTPSPRLRARLDKAYELYQAGYFPAIIVSGGIGKEGVDEAVAMRAYLIAHGIPAERVHADGLGNNTYLTAQNAARWMAEHDAHSALVISQYFHVPRARLALRRCGIDEVYSAHANYAELRDLYSTAREVAALYFYWLRPYE